MSKPILLVIAGCNGSGKSTHSKFLASSEFHPFDYDRYYLTYYKSLIDSDVRDVMAHNMARQELERQINSAIANRENFCYETNFNSTPLHWPNIFKKNGYTINMIFLCVDTISKAKRRVAIRVQNGGHYVSEDEITKRYYEGFSNLNKHYKFFNAIDLFDSSRHSAKPTHLLSIEKGNIGKLTNFPERIKKLLPSISKQVEGT